MLGLFPLVGIGKFSTSLPLLVTVTIRAPSVVSVEPVTVAVGKFSVISVLFISERPAMSVTKIAVCIF
jgi:hypothetical protein